MSQDMSITLCGPSALAALRTFRARPGFDFETCRRCDLAAPDPGRRGRWSRRDVAEKLSGIAALQGFSAKRPVHLAVPSLADRLRFVGARNKVYSQGLPANSFVELGDGLCASCPELLFVEMGCVMDPVVQLLLGMELCGCFTRDAAHPRSGEVSFGLSPLTSTQKIADYVSRCRDIDGLGQARETLEWLLGMDNAWSPMEAVVAALALLPVEELGYDLWPLVLNRREAMADEALLSTRVPDMLFKGSKVGLNYDGGDHLPLEELVDAAMRLAAEPGNARGEQELDAAFGRVRAASVGDKRRDRDLSVTGLTVLAVTKEDLFEPGGLDKVMLQVVACIEREGVRSLARQRSALTSPLLAKLRQERIWSLLPGRLGVGATRRLKQAFSPNPHPQLETVEIVGGVVQSVEEEYL